MVAETLDIFEFLCFEKSDPFWPIFETVPPDAGLNQTLSRPRGLYLILYIGPDTSTVFTDMVSDEFIAETLNKSMHPLLAKRQKVRKLLILILYKVYILIGFGTYRV